MSSSSFPHPRASLTDNALALTKGVLCYAMLQTYGLKCIPASGSRLNPNGDKPWFKDPAFLTSKRKYQGKGLNVLNGCATVNIFDDEGQAQDRMQILGSFVDW